MQKILLMKKKDLQIHGACHHIDLLAASIADRKLNLVLIVADDLGYADLGFHGVKDIPTPSLDALAAGGIRLTNGYVTGTWCSPSRAALMTGRYQQRFKENGHEPTPGNGLDLEETTLADRLRTASYQTGLVGNWRLGKDPQFHPPQRGFDEFFGFIRAEHNSFRMYPSSFFRIEMASVKASDKSLRYVRRLIIKSCAARSTS